MMTTPSRNPDLELRQALLGLAKDLAAGDPPAPASTIWLLAERRSRRLAIARATRPLRLMYALATVAALLAAVICLRHSGPASTALLTELLHWSVPALALVLLGCWAMIHSSRKPLTTNH
jgi:hypothetical protein